MKIFSKITKLNSSILCCLIGILSSGGCSALADNATCYTGSKGILCVRIKGNVPFAIMLFSDKKFAPMKKDFQISVDNKIYDVSDVINSPFLLNKGQVKGQPCRLGPEKVGLWPNGTTEYNFSDFSLWLDEEDNLICIRLMIEGINLWKDKKILISGNNISKFATNDFLHLIGEDIRKTKYFSEF
jgi:hypothetical protein